MGFTETGTKVTWKNPTVVPESQRQNGGWYYNPASGSVDHWFTDGGNSGGGNNNGGGGNVSAPSAPHIDTIWDSPEKLNNYLKDYQKSVLESYGIKGATDENGNVSYEKITSALTPTTDMPAPLNRVELFGQYRAAYGVDDLESNLNDLKGQQDDLVAQLRVNTAAERGKPVAQNIIEGRVSEQQRNIQEQVDFIGRQISRTTDQLNTAYNVIGMYMNFQQLDYQDAVDRYNQEFTQNMQIFGALRGLRQDALSEAAQQADVKFKQAGLDLQYQDAARSNLQIMMNAITNGNMDPSSLTSDQKLAINKLELQSGLPVGFTSKLGLSTKDRILFTTTNNGVTQVGIANSDGTISMKSYGTPTGGSTPKVGSAAYNANLNSQATGLMEKYKNSSGHVPPDVYSSVRATYVQQGGNVSDFTNNFKQYTDPNRNDFEAAYGFSKSVRASGVAKQDTYNNYYGGQ